MKKYTALMCFSALFTLSACFSNQKDEESDGSIAPDLAFFELKGPVHELNDSTNEIKCIFDKDGTLLTIDDRNPFTEEHLREFDEDSRIMIEHPRYNRDSLGQISQLAMYDGEINFVWDEGHIVSATGEEASMEWTSTYEYDDDGRLVKHAMNIWAAGKNPEEGESYSDEYSYETFDSYGNWITRRNGDDLESRSITYYETTNQ